VKLLWSVLDLAVSRADDTPPGDLRSLIAPAITFEALMRPVVFDAVDLDDQALRSPHEVRADHRLAVVQVEPLLNLGRRQPNAPAHHQHRLLDFALG
jgi:hypothetical protein